MFIRILHGCSIAIALMMVSSASFAEQAKRFKAAPVTNSANYLLSDPDMSGYKLSVQNMQPWKLAPKDGALRAILGVHQVWASPQNRELEVSYGSLETPEEAMEAASLFMLDTKKPFQEGAFAWQKEEDKSWIALFEGKETIVFVRGKVALSVAAIVDTEENRAELEAAVLKILGKIEQSPK